MTEQASDSTKLLRCRLRASWSHTAKLSFWLAAVLEIVLLSMARDWFWLSILPLLGLFAWFLERESRTLKNTVSSLVEETAAKLNMRRGSENQQS